MPAGIRMVPLLFPAIFSLIVVLLLLPRPGLQAAEDESLAGVAVREGEVYYWPVLAGENPAAENRLVIMERDARTVSLLARVDFQPRSADLLPGSVPVLDQLAEVLNDNPDLAILIKVRSEKPGKAGSDLASARERAGRIRDFLLAKGIDASRLAAEGIQASAGERKRREEPPLEIAITGQDQDLNPRWMSLKNNTDFYANDEIKTGNGKVKILFSNGAVLVLLPRTYARIIAAGRVRLLRGGLLGNLDNYQSDQEFFIETAEAGASLKSGSFIAEFVNGVSAFGAIQGGLTCHLRAEPEKILPLPAGKGIVIQSGSEPEKPKAITPGEIRDFREEFNLGNFDSSQSLFDEEIRKRTEKIQPPAPEKSPVPSPPR